MRGPSGQAQDDADNSVPVDSPDTDELRAEPNDDADELTEEEERELAESIAELDRGEGRPFEEFMRELMASRTPR